MVWNSVLFKNAAAWQKRKDGGETQASIAEHLSLSEAVVSRTLKCGRLPNDEKLRSEQMLQDRRITEAAVMDLADSGDPAFRQQVLEAAIRHRKVRDVKNAKRSGKKGMTSDAGKVTVDEIRSAVKEIRAKRVR